MYGIIIAYSGNTSNLTYYLQHEHPREHRELVEEGRQTEDNFVKPAPSGNATAKSVQITLGGAITRSAPLSMIRYTVKRFRLL